MTDATQPTGLTEERLEILRLVENQTITAEEAGRILEALDRSDKAERNERITRQVQVTAPFVPSPPEAPIPPSNRNRSVRIRISDTTSGKAQINLVLPYRLVDSGIKMAKRFAPEQMLDSKTIRRSIDEGFSGPLLDIIEGDQRIEIIVETMTPEGDHRQELKRLERMQNE